MEVTKGDLPAEVTREVVGRRSELRLLLHAVEGGKAVLLVGLPGVSKTTMLRALARHLGTQPDRFVDVTGDEQLTAHALAGTFDPPMVLREGYRPEHFVPGPLTRAMRAGGILYVEEINRAPAGALNALMTALSEGYLEIPRLGRVEAAPGFTVVGALNPLDDVGTVRLSRGLADRFLVLELDYQSRGEELEIVHRRCGGSRMGAHGLAVDLARASRGHVDLRHGASVRAAIDLVDLLAGYAPAELDASLLGFLACAAYAGRLRLRPAVRRTACEIVHELLEAVLGTSYGGSVEAFARELAAAPSGEAADAGAGPATPGEQGDVGLEQGGEKAAPQRRPPDEIPGLVRPGGSDEAGDSRSIPMVERDRPSARGARVGEPGERPDGPLHELDEVLRRARQYVLRPSGGRSGPGGQSSEGLTSLPWTEARTGTLDEPATVDALVAGAGHLERRQLRVLTREPRVRNYVILIDHSGSMAGRKLELGATMAGVLAHLTVAGRADYAVIAFDDQLQELKGLGDDQDVEQVVDRILRLPEGRATDLGKALEAAAARAERAPGSTDVILISDCMPTRGVTTFEGLRRLAGELPSLSICFTDEQAAAIRMFNGERQMDLYQWWARQWVGEDRLAEVGDLDEMDRLVDLLSSERSNPREV